MSLEKEELREEMNKMLESGNGSLVTRFALSCLGSIPFVGGAFGAGAGAWSEKEQSEYNKMFAAWLKLQEDEIKEIGITLAEVMIRVDITDEKIKERLQSREYLSILKKAFRDWSATESDKKRILIRNLLANSASTRLTTDDVVKLFVEWIGSYSEAHFDVIGVIYNNEGITRYQMWQELHGEKVREDSAEADLFKLIMHDLSIGHVIRQYRPIDRSGNFLKVANTKKRTNTRIMKSAFDNEKPYELTELGRQFVHYTMNEIVPRLEQSGT
jgi:hypothetical protein